MLGSLSGKHHIPLRNLVLAEDVVQTAGEAALHSGTRRHTGSQGHVAGKGNVETLDGNAKFLELLGDTIDIACPRSLGAVGVAEFEVHTVLQVDGISHNGVFSSISSHFCSDTLVDGAREDESAVVIGMLTNQVDTSG